MSQYTPSPSAISDHETRLTKLEERVKILEKGGDAQVSETYPIVKTPSPTLGVEPFQDQRRASKQSVEPTGKRYDSIESMTQDQAQAVRAEVIKRDGL